MIERDVGKQQPKKKTTKKQKMLSFSRMLFQEPFIQSHSDSSPAALIFIKLNIRFMFGDLSILNPIQRFWAIPSFLQHIN